MVADIPRTKPRRIGLGWVIPLMMCLLAWQGTPPLLLTVVPIPPMATSGEALTLVVTVLNTGREPLQDVLVIVPIPDGTTFREAMTGVAGWVVETLPQSRVQYRATGPLAPGQSVQLVLRVNVQQGPGSTLAIEGYNATAKGIEKPVAGERTVVRVGPLPTEAPRTPAAPTATPTLPVTPVTPSPAASRSPTPSPTVTVVLAELPPTPTPNLTTQQEQLGTLTVSIFSAFTLAMAIYAAVWLLRRNKKA